MLIYANQKNIMKPIVIDLVGLKVYAQWARIKKNFHFWGSVVKFVITL